MIVRHFVPFLLCLGAFSASAQNVISITGTSGGTDNELAVGQSSWTQSGTYTGVTIQATIESCFGPATGTAYLTMNGTALANQVAVNNSLSVNGGTNGADTTVTLFSGLTLGPGTYYLTISPNPGECNELWQNISGSPTVAVASGVAAATSGGTGAGHTVAPYPPQSTFSDAASYLFSVTGTPSGGPTPTPTPTPAPSTFVLLGIATLLVSWYAWRFRGQSN